MSPQAATRRGAPALALLAMAVFGVSPAQQADPPARVARLSDVEGTVAVQPAGLQDWSAAVLNRPLTTSDRLWSEQNARAELDIGSAAVRLGSATAFSFFSLDDRIAQMQLTTGTLLVQVRDMQADQVYEVDTPNVAVMLLEPGVYRIEVDEAGTNTVVKVSAGRAEATGGGQYFGIGAQQAADFAGAGSLTLTVSTLAGPDELDEWASARELVLEQSASRTFVPPDMPGTQDLDDNGAWQQTAEYGYVWAPFIVVAGWAPYGFGHWAWIAPWGWTWIDAQPWGYAPFHYGRWVMWNSTWCWVPGPRTTRPVYAPALVAWVGVADGRRPAPGQPGVAWFALGPREPFRPSYGASPRYAQAINPGVSRDAAAGSVVAGHYVNNKPAAVIAVPESVFTSGQPVGPHGSRVAAEVLAASTVTATAPALAPQRDSVLGGMPARALRPPPPAQLNRVVVALTPPPPAAAPFERQLAAVQANGNRPLTGSELAQLAPRAAAAPVRMLPAATVPALRAPVTAVANDPTALRPVAPGMSPGSGYRPPASAGATMAPSNESPPGRSAAHGVGSPHPATPVVPAGSTPRTPLPGPPVQPYRSPVSMSGASPAPHPAPAAPAPAAHDPR